MWDASPVAVVLEPSACEYKPDAMFASPLLNDPVIPKDPVIKALPVYGNAGVEGAYEALKAFVAYEAVPCNVPVNEPLNDPVFERNVSTRAAVKIVEGVLGCVGPTPAGIVSNVITLACSTCQHICIKSPADKLK